MTDWLAGWLVGWLAGWLPDWLIDWLIHRQDIKEDFVLHYGLLRYAAYAVLL